MKILVVSDSHGHDELLEELALLNKDCDLFLDAGDSLTSIYTIPPYHTVKGNCDYYPFPEKFLYRLPQGNIFMRHYPYIEDKEKEGVRIFIHGHTHRYEIKNEGDLIILCPGSISLPRDNSNGSYAIITINGDKINIDVIDVFTKNILLSL